GDLTLSADGKLLTLCGYNTTVGGITTSSDAATTNRVVAIVDSTGNIASTTPLTDFADKGAPRSAVTSNGKDIWAAGSTGGVVYTTAGSTTSTQLSTTVTNLRRTNIFDGQLYVSDASGSAVRIGTVGTGLPTTSGQTITNLNGFTTVGSTYSFYLADLSSMEP